MQKHIFKAIWLSGMIFLIACTTSIPEQAGIVDSKHILNASLDAEAAIDTAFVNLVKSYKEGIDFKMNQPVSVTSEAMMSGRPESLLSNYIADAMLAIGNKYCWDNKLGYGVDISIINNGGLRTSLPKGEITTGKLFELLPFENKLAIIGMKGSDLQNVLKYIAVRDGEGVSGIKMGIKGDEAVDVKIGGKKLDLNKVYHIISIDYLINGGDGMSSFEKRENFRHIHMKLREAIIDHAKFLYKSGVGIKAELDGRIYYEQ